VDYFSSFYIGAGELSPFLDKWCGECSDEDNLCDLIPHAYLKLSSLAVVEQDGLELSCICLVDDPTKHRKPTDRPAALQCCLAAIVFGDSKTQSCGEHSSFPCL